LKHPHEHATFGVGIRKASEHRTKKLRQHMLLLSNY
jgi:hypothetical protein